MNLRQFLGFGHVLLTSVCEKYEPTVSIDICESAVFTNFAIKAIYAMWNDNCIQLFES